MTDRGEVLAELGVTHLTAGHLEKAAQCLESSTQAGYDTPAVYYNLGLALAGLGRLEEAACAFRTAIDRDSSLGDAHINLGATLHRMGRFDDAIEALRTGIACSPDNSRGHNNLGLSLLEIGDAEAAVKCFARSVECESGYAQAHYNLGNALMQRDEHDGRAEASYRRCVELDPGHHLAWTNLGASHFVQDRLAQSIRCFRGALSAKGDYAPARINLQTALSSVDEARRWTAWDEGWAIQLGDEQALHGLAVGAKGHTAALLQRDLCQILDTTSQADPAVVNVPWSQQRFMAFAPDGDTWVGTSERSILIYSRSTRVLASGELGAAVRGLCCGPGGYLALTFADGIAILQSGNELKTVASIPCLPLGFGMVAFDPQGDRMVVAMAGGRPGCALCESSSGKPIRSFTCNAPLVCEPRFSRDGSKLFVLDVSEQPFTLLSWDVESGRAEESASLAGPDAGLSSTTLAPFAEAWGAFHDATRVLRIWNTSTDASIDLGEKQGRHLAFSPDGRHLASVDHDRLVKTWNMGAGR